MDEKETIALLKEAAGDDKEAFERVLAHVKAVQKVALRIAEKVSGINLETVRIGSLLHDIGRFSGNGIDHGIKGAEILRNKGLETFARIAETHIGAGINEQDIEEQKLDIPKKDYTPKTKEEKIIAHADNLIFGAEERPFQAVYDRFEKEISIKIAERCKKLKEEIESWISTN